MIGTPNLSERTAVDAMVACMSAINDGVAEMLIKGTKLPSINASLRVANCVRRLERAADGSEGFVR